MPRINSTTWSAGNPITAARLEDINEDLDNVYATWSDHFKVYRLTGDPALQVRIGPGTYRVGGTEWQYYGGTLTVGTSVTTYIMIDSAGSIQTSTSAWNSQYTRLAVVVSGASTIISITDWRNKVVWWVLWWLTFYDTRGSNTTPNNYNDSTFKAQFKTITDIGLNGIATGTYARLIGGRGWWEYTGGDAFETAYTDDWIYHRTGSTTTWNSWKKLWYKNDLTFWSVINLSGIPTASTLLSKWWFISAVWYAVGNLGSETVTLTIQTSPNNWTWTDYMSVTVWWSTAIGPNSWEAHSPYISWFIASGLYVRVNMTWSMAYKVSINANIQPFN